MAISAPEPTKGKSLLSTELSFDLLKSVKLPSRNSSGLPKSQAEKLWLVAGALGALVIIAIGYLLVIAPQRSTASGVDRQADAARMQNVALQARIVQLRTQSRQLSTLRAQLSKDRLALPEQAEVSDFVRSLQSIGAASLVSLPSLTVGQPSAVSAPATVPSSPTATASPAAAGASPATSAPTGVYSIPISVQATGSVDGLNAFLEQLQQVQPRAVLVTQLNESTNSTESSAAKGSYSLALSMLAFMQPPTTTVTTPPAGQATP